LSERNISERGMVVIKEYIGEGMVVIKEYIGEGNGCHKEINPL
jgi:hypothetical protein